MVAENKVGSTECTKLSKVSTGIKGLDEITGGGLPEGRATLLAGGPGCGKTTLGIEFLISGAINQGEAGLFVSFEESQQHMLQNFRNLPGNLAALIEQSLIKVSHIDLTSVEIFEAGQFSLEGLLLRIEHNLREINATRVVIDSIDSLYSVVSRSANLRYEFGRLMNSLAERGLTTLVTCERSSATLTQFGFEDFIVDCVIFLDHRLSEQVSKRRLRIVKYRGSNHGKDEYPYLIGDKGFSVLPITSLQLDYNAYSEWVSSGVEDIDKLLGGNGYFRGSSVLVSGRAGAGKSSLSAAFACATAVRGETCLYFSFEESEMQLVRNMRSVGIDLAPHLDSGRVVIRAFRPTFRGLEEHLVSLTAAIDYIKPASVVIDPISNFLSIGTPEDVKSLLTRVIDHLKKRGVTMIFTALTPGSGRPDETDTALSSIVDTWIALDLVLSGNHRHREIYVVKSRGMRHSHEILELAMSDQGFSLNPLASEQIP